MHPRIVRNEKTGQLKSIKVKSIKVKSTSTSSPPKLEKTILLHKVLFIFAQFGGKIIQKYVFYSANSFSKSNFRPDLFEIVCIINFVQNLNDFNGRS